MKKLLIIGCFVSCWFQASVARVVTVIPYTVDALTGRRLVLIGRQFHVASILSEAERRLLGSEVCSGVWALPQSFGLFSAEDPLRAAAKMFNEKTMYSFIRPCGAHLSGYDAGLFECGAQGAYANRGRFNQAVEVMIGDQVQKTSAVNVGDHYYFFLQVQQFISAQLLGEKRAFLRATYPGYVDDGLFSRLPRVVVNFGADFEEFAWVDGVQLVQFFRCACTAHAAKMNVVMSQGAVSYEIDYQLLVSLSEDVGVVDAIARVLCS